MSEMDNAAESAAAEPANDRALTPHEASEVVGLSVLTLRDYRSRRDRRFGPPFHKHGRTVTYRLSELLEWMDGRAGR